MIEITRINLDRFGIIEEYFLRVDTGYWEQYKRRDASAYFTIIFSRSFTFNHSRDFGLFLNWVIMSQSQLLGNIGEMRNGEGTHKRLKLSVPHFDNSALIKTYAKTLIGRYMNPEEQDMGALITNLPKI